eukprot:gene11756-8084_t
MADAPTSSSLQQRCVNVLLGPRSKAEGVPPEQQGSAPPPVGRTRRQASASQDRSYGVLGRTATVSAATASTWRRCENPTTAEVTASAALAGSRSRSRRRDTYHSSSSSGTFQVFIDPNTAGTTQRTNSRDKRETANSNRLLEQQQEQQEQQQPTRRRRAAGAELSPRDGPTANAAAAATQKKKKKEAAAPHSREGCSAEPTAHKEADANAISTAGQHKKLEAATPTPPPTSLAAPPGFCYPPYPSYMPAPGFLPPPPAGWLYPGMLPIPQPAEAAQDDNSTNTTTHKAGSSSGTSCSSMSPSFFTPQPPAGMLPYMHPAAAAAAAYQQAAVMAAAMAAAAAGTAGGSAAPMYVPNPAAAALGFLPYPATVPPPPPPPAAAAAAAMGWTAPALLEPNQMGPHHCTTAAPRGISPLANAGDRGEAGAGRGSGGREASPQPIAPTGAGRRTSGQQKGVELSHSASPPAPLAGGVCCRTGGIDVHSSTAHAARSRFSSSQRSLRPESEAADDWSSPPPPQAERGCGAARRERSEAPPPLPPRGGLLLGASGSSGSSGSKAAPTTTARHRSLTSASQSQPPQQQRGRSVTFEAQAVEVQPSGRRRPTTSSTASSRRTTSESQDPDEPVAGAGGASCGREQRLPVLLKELQAEVALCRGKVLSIATTLEGKCRLQRLLRRLRRALTRCAAHKDKEQLETPSCTTRVTVDADPEDGPASKTAPCRDVCGAQLLLGEAETKNAAAEDVEEEVDHDDDDDDAATQAAAAGVRALYSECLELLLTELSVDLNQAGLDEHACHVLKAAIHHCDDVALLYRVVVSRLSDTTILNWCAATHYSRGIIESIFAKEAAIRESRSEGAAAGAAAAGAAAEVVEVPPSLTSPLMRVMVQNTTYLAVMQQGCLCFTHCYANYCTAAQQRLWLLEGGEAAAATAAASGAVASIDVVRREKEAIPFATRLCPLLKELALDCYGNYTVQCLVTRTLDRSLMLACTRAFLLPHLVPLALHKQGSNVVEAVIEQCAPEMKKAAGGGHNEAKKREQLLESSTMDHLAKAAAAAEARLLRRDILQSFGLLPPCLTAEETREVGSPAPAQAKDDCCTKASTATPFVLPADEREAAATLDLIISNAFGNFVVQAVLTHWFTPFTQPPPPPPQLLPGDVWEAETTCEEGWERAWWPAVQERCRAALFRSASPYTLKLGRLLHCLVVGGGGGAKEKINIYYFIFIFSSLSRVALSSSSSSSSSFSRRKVRVYNNNNNNNKRTLKRTEVVFCFQGSTGRERATLPTVLQPSSSSFYYYY